ncbi:hypothetical protein ACWGS9_28270 [Bradyrhizobium sp. Arg314]
MDYAGLHGSACGLTHEAPVYTCTFPLPNLQGSDPLHRCVWAGPHLFKQQAYRTAAKPLAACLRDDDDQTQQNILAVSLQSGEADRLALVGEAKERAAGFVQIVDRQTRLAKDTAQLRKVRVDRLDNHCGVPSPG